MTSAVLAHLRAVEADLKVGPYEKAKDPVTAVAKGPVTAVAKGQVTAVAKGPVTAVGADLQVGPCEPLTLRQATPTDAPAIHALIENHVVEGHLLPRSLSAITVHAHRFVVAVVDEAVVGCVDLAPLSRTVAEVRSLVVSGELRSTGVGRHLIDAVVSSARRAGFERICAFTHAPSYFVQRGFSLVPHEWLPEKIRTDCGSCALFRRCHQYALVLPLARVNDACVPLASLHG